MKKLLSVTLITLGISLTITNIHAMGQNNNSSSDTSSNTTAPSNTQISPAQKEKIIKICAKFINLEIKRDQLRTEVQMLTSQELQAINGEIFETAAQLVLSRELVTINDLEKFGESEEKNLDCDQK